VIQVTSKPVNPIFYRVDSVWGVKPLLIEQESDTFETVLGQVETCLKERNLVDSGDRVLVMGGIPMRQTGGTNFLKLHTV
jgi:pyruvate kinase